ncbi:hypothetical protein KBC79_06655, partial [Candidatus Woesebacteria bacterium]|nr:hypothetical protein [Candidatus Woesebacteria bacterium]
VEIAARDRLRDELINAIFTEQGKAISDWIAGGCKGPCPDTKKSEEIATAIDEAIARAKSEERIDDPRSPISLSSERIGIIRKLAGQPTDEQLQASRELVEHDKSALMKVISEALPIRPESRAWGDEPWENEEFDALPSSILPDPESSTINIDILTFQILQEWSNRAPLFALTSQVLTNRNAPGYQESRLGNAKYLATHIATMLNESVNGDDPNVQALQTTERNIRFQIADLNDRVDSIFTDLAELDVDEKDSVIIGTYAILSQLLSGEEVQIDHLERVFDEINERIENVKKRFSRVLTDSQSFIEDQPNERAQISTKIRELNRQLSMPPLNNPNTLRDALERVVLERSAKYADSILEYMGDLSDPNEGTHLFELRIIKNDSDPSKIKELTDLQRRFEKDKMAITTAVVSLSHVVTQIRTLAVDLAMANADIAELKNDLVTREQIDEYVARQRDRMTQDIPNRLQNLIQSGNNSIRDITPYIAKDQLKNIQQLWLSQAPKPEHARGIIEDVDYSITRARRKIESSEEQPSQSFFTPLIEAMADRYSARTAQLRAATELARAKAAEISDRLGRPRVVVSGERTSVQSNLFVIPDRDPKDDYETADWNEVAAILARWSNAWRNRGELPPLDYVDLVTRLINSGMQIDESYQRLALRTAIIGNHNINEVITAMSTNTEDIASVMRDLLLHPARPLDIRVIIDIYNSTGNRIWLTELYAQLQEEAREPLEPRRTHASEALEVLDDSLPFTISHPTFTPIPTRHIPPPIIPTKGPLPPLRAEANAAPNWESDDEVEVKGLLNDDKDRYRSSNTLPPTDYVDLVLKWADKNEKLVSDYLDVALEAAIVHGYKIDALINEPKINMNVDRVARNMRFLLLDHYPPVSMDDMLRMPSSKTADYIRELLKLLEQESSIGPPPRIARVQECISKITSSGYEKLAPTTTADKEVYERVCANSEEIASLDAQQMIRHLRNLNTKPDLPTVISFIARSTPEAQDEFYRFVNSEYFANVSDPVDKLNKIMLLNADPKISAELLKITNTITGLRDNNIILTQEQFLWMIRVGDPVASVSLI